MSNQAATVSWTFRPRTTMAKRRRLPNQALKTGSVSVSVSVWARIRDWDWVRVTFFPSYFWDPDNVTP